MIRISTIFVAICMVLIAASLGLALYAVAGISGSESAIVALTALTFLILYNVVSMRLRDRTDVGSQIADLSRGTADLARQVAEFGRRLASVETKLASANSSGAERVDTAFGEINELGGLVKQLAASVASHEELLTAAAVAPAATIPAAGREPDKSASELPRLAGAEPARTAAAASGNEAAPSRGPAPILAALRSAVDENRLDIYLQPLVTLPQRKVRFYEAVTRLRDDRDQMLAAEDFIGIAEAAGLIGRIDHLVVLRCVQVLRRLMVRNKEIGLFCNMAAATLGNAANFSHCLDFLDANRALASSFVLEFKQSTFRSLGPTEAEHLAALAQRGYRFSMDHVTDLRIEPRELADRGVRYIKVPAALLLDPKQTSSDIHPSDLSDLLGRFGIDLIAERIEGERSVVDLLDFDVRFGQGFLFAPPRPLRAEGTAANGTASPNNPQGAKADRTDIKIDVNGFGKPGGTEPAAMGAPPRATGNAALARRVAGPA